MDVQEAEYGGDSRVRMSHCGKKIYVHEEFVREQMYCTLGCLDTFDKRNGHNSRISMINRI